MADKWNVILIASFIMIAFGIFGVMILSFENQKSAEIPIVGFPNCLRVLQCEGVNEFEGIPFEQLEIIADNYEKCFDDFKLEITCQVQVKQDIERFYEKGYVTER